MLRPHVRHEHGVHDGRVHVEAARTAEEAHLVTLGLDRYLDPERAQEAIGPEPCAVHDDGGVDADVEKAAASAP